MEVSHQGPLLAHGNSPIPLQLDIEIIRYLPRRSYYRFNSPSASVLALVLIEPHLQTHCIQAIWTSRDPLYLHA